MQTNAPASKPSPSSSSSPTSQFIGMALDMSWRLAIVVLVPIVGGFELDKRTSLSPLLTITGFILAMIGTGLVMWLTLQAANKATRGVK